MGAQPWGIIRNLQSPMSSGGTGHIGRPCVFLVVADAQYEHGGDQRF